MDRRVAPAVSASARHSRWLVVAAAAGVFALTLARTGLRDDRLLLTFDGASWVERVLDIAEGREQPLVGNVVANQGIHLGPLAADLAVPAVWTGRSIGAIGVWFGFLTAVAGAVLVLFGAARFGPVAGVLAGLFFALNPAILESAVQIRHDGALPALCVLAFLVSVRAVERRSRFPLGAGLAVGFATQSHAIAVAYLPVLPLGAWLARRPLRWTGWLGYALGIGVTYVTWLAVDASHGFRELRAIVGLAGGGTFAGTEGEAGRSLLAGLAMETHPALVLRVGLALGVSIGICALARRHDVDREADESLAIMACCLVSLAFWALFTGLVVVRSPGFQEAELGRFFVPALIPAFLLAGLGWGWPACSWRPLLPRLAPRASGVAAVALAAIAMAGATGAIGEGAPPYWEWPGAKHDPAADGGNPWARLVWCRRVNAILLRALGDRRAGHVIWVGTQGGRAEADPENVDRIHPLLRVAAGRATSSKEGGGAAAAIGVIHDGPRACGHGMAPAAADAPAIGAEAFDDCAALRSWVIQADDACAEAGLQLRAQVRSVSPSVPDRPCDDDRDWTEWLAARGGAGQREGTLADSLATDVLLRDLESGTPRARTEAAWSLGRRTDDATSAVALERAFDDADPRVRIAAIWSLSRLTAPGVIPARMRAALDDPADSVRTAARNALEAFQRRVAKPAPANT